MTTWSGGISPCCSTRLGRHAGCRRTWRPTRVLRRAAEPAQGLSAESEVEEREPEDRTVAEGLTSQAFHVLHEWSWVPGGRTTMARSTGTRSTMAEGGPPALPLELRAEVGDRQIGDIFSAAPGMDIGLAADDIRRRSSIVACAAAQVELGVNRQGVTSGRRSTEVIRRETGRIIIARRRAASRSARIGWGRLADRLADMYEADARRLDDWTEQREH